MELLKVLNTQKIQTGGNPIENVKFSEERISQSEPSITGGGGDDNVSIADSDNNEKKELKINKKFLDIDGGRKNITDRFNRIDENYKKKINESVIYNNLKKDNENIPELDDDINADDIKSLNIKYQTDKDLNSNAEWIFGIIHITAVAIEKLLSRFAGSINVDGYSGDLLRRKEEYIKLLVMIAAPKRVVVKNGKSVLVDNDSFMSKINVSLEFRLVSKFIFGFISYALKSNSYDFLNFTRNKKDEEEEINKLDIPDD